LSTLCGELNAKQLCLRDDVLMELSKASDLGAFLKIFIILNEWGKLSLHWRFIRDDVAGIIARKLASDAIRNSTSPTAFKPLHDLK
jgi:hypothetical protein